jgi:hypothetical protein
MTSFDNSSQTPTWGPYAKNQGNPGDASTTGNQSAGADNRPDYYSFADRGATQSTTAFHDEVYSRNQGSDARYQDTDQGQPVSWSETGRDGVTRIYNIRHAVINYCPQDGVDYRNPGQEQYDYRQYDPNLAFRREQAQLSYYGGNQNAWMQQRLLQEERALRRDEQMMMQPQPPWMRQREMMHARQLQAEIQAQEQAMNGGANYGASLYAGANYSVPPYYANDGGYCPPTNYYSQPGGIRLSFMVGLGGGGHHRR